MRNLTTVRVAAFTLLALAATLIIPSGIIHAWDAQVHPELNGLGVDLLARVDRNFIYKEISSYKGVIEAGGLEEDESVDERTNGNTNDNCDATRNDYTIAPTIDGLFKKWSYPRSRKHFYHPGTGLGVSNRITSRETNWGVRCKSAVKWARNDENVGHTWEGAIRSYGNVGYSAFSRAGAYRKVGHVAHLVGDMAQPDHVHLEPHNVEGGIEKVLGWTGVGKLTGTSLDIFAWDNWESVDEDGEEKDLDAVLGELKPKLGPLTPIRFDRMELHLIELAKITYDMSSFPGELYTLGDDSDDGVNKNSWLGRMFDISFKKAKKNEWVMKNKKEWDPAFPTVGDWDGTYAGDKWADGDEWYETYFETGTGERGLYFIERNEKATPALFKEVRREGNGYEVDWVSNTVPIRLEEQLARELLPLAVEYIAGLYMHFYDVVNHPPILASALVQQGSRCNRDARWNPILVENSPNPRVWHVGSRELADSCQTPEAERWINGVDGPVAITLKFEADYGVNDFELVDDPDSIFPDSIIVTATHVLKPMRSVTVKIGDVEVPGSLNRKKGLWTTEFSPPSDGSLDGIKTMAVSGRDVAPHFSEGPNEYGEMIARNYPGGELDTDPANLAFAQYQEPYNWENYQPGGDTTHTLMIDVTPPQMILVSAGVDDRNRTVATYAVEDPTSGLKVVEVDKATNAVVAIPTLAPGAKTLLVTVSVEDRTRSAEVAFALEDEAGNPNTVSVFIPVKAIKRGPAVPPENPLSRGLTPVVVLADDGFDVFSIDIETVVFGPGGATPEFHGHYQDLDGDHDRDLMLFFPTEEAGIEPDHLSVHIAARTMDEDHVVSAQAIRTVGRDTVPIQWPNDADLSLIRLRDQPVPTTEVPEPGAIPRSSRLLSPLPNPTRAGVRLHYGIAATASVDLKIYDVRGRLIARVLENETVGPGWQEASWAGTDSHGQPVANGVYYARLTVDGAPAGEARRFIVVR